ncbi:MAG: FG-GAP repeat domain-containing protein [Blastococcus sp.]
MPLRRLLPVLAVVAGTLVPLAAPPAGASGASLALRGIWNTPVMAQTSQVTQTEMFSSPVVGDIDGDGQPDVVAGYSNGHIYAWHENGTRFLDITTPYGGQVRNAPALVDLNKDGKLDILGSNQSGFVYAYTGRGARLFAVRVPVHNNQQGVFSSPVAADLDHNGSLEIIATSWDHYVWVWDLAGHVHTGFPVFVQDTIWSSPTIADLNGDGAKDIVFGYDCVGTPGDNCYRDYRKGGGYVTAINYLGKTLPGWPRFTPGQVVWSTPAVQDITGDNKPDVIVGSGLYWNPPAGAQVNGFDGAGHTLAGFPLHTSGRVFGEPAIGDMNGDGRMEIAAMDEYNFVYLWDRAGHLIWKRCGSNDGRCTGRAHAAPVMADIMGTGHPQVIVAGQTTVRAFAYNGATVATLRVEQGLLPIVSTPLATSLGGEATVLLSTNRRTSAGWFGAIERLGTGVPLGAAPWPQFRQNLRGTGHKDDLTPPLPTKVSGSATSATSVKITMGTSDAQSGVQVFDSYYRDNGGALVHWAANKAPTSRVGTAAYYTASFAAASGHSYRVQARARDREGNWGDWGVYTVVTP